MLAFNAIEAGYGQTVVLRDINLTVPSGSVCALLGPNGAGKTTMLGVASGMVSVRRGTVSIDGRDVTSMSPFERTELGLCHIPEGRGIFRSLTVRENLVLFSAPGHGDEAIERATDAFPRLRDRLQQVAGTMSGGEQQMLALARAYVSNARIVLVDEVSMGLAPLIVDAIFEFLGKLAANGTSLLLVEQYVSRALEIAEYVYLLDRGQLSFAGEPAELADDDLIERYLGTEVRA